MNKTSFRARVSALPTGQFLVTPVNEGSKGSPYTTIAATQHAKCMVSKSKYKVVFELPSTESANYMTRCLTEEINQIVKYLNALKNDNAKS